MIVSTKFKVKHVSDLVCILLRFSAFLALLNKFGIILLEAKKLPDDVAHLQILPKLTHILNKFCHDYGHNATYEKIISVLTQLNLLSASDAVEAEAKRKRSMDTEWESKVTKYQVVDISNIMKILLSDLEFLSQTNHFATLLGMPTANAEQETNLERLLYQFQEWFPKYAAFEILIDVVGNQMGYQKLAEDIKSKFNILNNSRLVLPKLVQREPIFPCESLSLKKENQGMETLNSSWKYFLNFCEKYFSTVVNSDYKPEYISIKEGATGYSYKKLFGKYLTDRTHNVTIEDPYLKEPHQFKDLQVLIQLIFESCPNLMDIVIVSKYYRAEDIFALSTTFKVNIILKQNKSLHDRQLIIWNLTANVVTLGRGLDIFYPPNDGNGHQICQEQLKCRATTITVFPNADLSNFSSSGTDEEIINSSINKNDDGNLKLKLTNGKIDTTKPDILKSDSSSEEVRNPITKIPKKKSRRQKKGKKLQNGPI